MKISNIKIEISPWYRPHHIELFCTMIVDGETVSWKEIFPDSDFETRAEGYLDLMKHKIIDSIKRKEATNGK